MRGKSIIPRLKYSIAESCRTTLFRNSLWMFLGYGVKIIIQAGYFILIARTLGVREYGLFVGVTALVAILSPFAGFGAGNLLIKNVSRDRRRFAVYWGNALLVTLVSGVFVLGLVLLAGRLVLPSSIPLGLIVLAGLADILALRIIDLTVQAFQSVDQLHYTAALNLLPNVLRLFGAAFAFVAWHRMSALRWSWLYFAGSLVSAAFAVLFTSWKLGAPGLALGRIRRELLEGLYFSISLSAQTIYNDIDKTMLARLSTYDAAGIYAAASRLIDVSFTPVRSVSCAAYANFFRHGKNGIHGSYAYARRLLPKMAGYSLLIFLGLTVAAPLAPVVLGGEYGRTVGALRWLALLPLLKSVHSFLADSITGAGHQGFRTAAQLVAAAVNILLNLRLVPAYSWRGAAWSSLAANSLLIVVLFAGVQWLHARSGHEVERRDELLTADV